MNTIKINEKECKEILNYNGTRYFENFIFNEFRIIVIQNGYKVVYKIKIDGNVNEVTYVLIKGNESKDCKFIFTESEEEVEFIEKPNGKLINELAINVSKLPYRRQLEEIQKQDILFRDEMKFITKFKQYIMNKSYERKTIQKNVVKLKTNKTTRKVTSVKKNNVQYLLNDIVEYVSHNSGIHNITCECWVVRGHFRHYKSGRIVFIKPYEKGKKRNSIKPADKIYKL